MSFSFATTAEVGHTDEAIDKVVEGQIATATEGYVPNVIPAKELGMIDAAKAHVRVVAEAIAREGDLVSISITGHANPSKDRNSGWASNMLNVNVSQVYGDDPS